MRGAVLLYGEDHVKPYVFMVQSREPFPKTTGAGEQVDDGNVLSCSRHFS